MALLVPGAIAFAFGWFAFRSRVTGVYFAIISQAMTFALMLSFFRNDMGFGGNNGLTDFKELLGFDLRGQGTRATLFIASGLALLGGFFLCRAIVTSKFGKILVGIRDAESRTRFLGYRVEHYKLFVFTLSAMIAGVAGDAARGEGGLGCELGEMRLIERVGFLAQRLTMGLAALARFLRQIEYLQCHGNILFTTDPG